MGRKKNERKSELIEKLGLQDSTHNWSLAELEKKWESQQKKDEKLETAKQIAGEVPLEEETLVPTDLRDLDVPDPWNGLTEQQRYIARLKLRGLSQKTIAQIVGVSQPTVSNELKAIRDFQETKGKGLNQATVIGETATLYEEIEYQAWQVFHTSAKDPQDKLKALEAVNKARQSHIKLLMDVGLVEKAGSKIKHTIEVVSPFIEEWKKQHVSKQVADHLVESSLKALPEPQKDIIEADFELTEKTNDLDVEFTELEEPSEDEDLEVEDD